jgi:hypothetical protein
MSPTEYTAIAAIMAAVPAGPCVYCGLPNAATVDHVIPRSRGGAHASENLVRACRRCNSQKGKRTPDEWQERRRARGLPWPPIPPTDVTTDRVRTVRPTRPAVVRTPEADDKWHGYIQALVEAAPPLTQEQRDQLAALLRPNADGGA